MDQNNLALLRKQRRLSQTQVARKLNMTQSAYGKIERGKTRLPADLLQKLTAIYQVDTNEILGVKSDIKTKASASVGPEPLDVQRKILTIFIDQVQYLVLSRYSDIMVNFEGVPLEYEDFDEEMIEIYKENYNIYSAEDYYHSEVCPFPYTNTFEEEYEGFKKLMDDTQIYYFFKFGMYDYEDDPTFSRCWEMFQREKTNWSRPAQLKLPPNIIKECIKSIRKETL